MHAGAEAGEFVTPMLQLDDSRSEPPRLAINISTSAVGSVRVELQDEQGLPLPGYSLAECAEIFGDELSRPVAWGGTRRLPRDRPFRLRFVMRDADLFALVIE